MNITIYSYVLYFSLYGPPVKIHPRLRAFTKVDGIIYTWCVTPYQLAVCFFLKDQLLLLHQWSCSCPFAFILVLWMLVKRPQYENYTGFKIQIVFSDCDGAVTATSSHNDVRMPI